MVSAVSLSVGLVLVNAHRVAHEEGSADDAFNLSPEASPRDDIESFLTEYGYGTEDIDRAAAMVAHMDDASDRRKGASHYLMEEAKNAELGLSQTGEGWSLAETNSSTGGYFDDNGHIGLYNGGTFLGPLFNTKCNGPSSTRGGSVDSCAQACTGSCRAFAMNGGNCEFYTDCHGSPHAADGFMLYVKNTEGIEEHLLPTRRVGGRTANFFVIGDWGGSTSPNRASMHYVRHNPPGTETYNNDHYAQDNVGRRMGEIGANSHPSMVVNAGDNFYWGGINHWTRGGHGVHDRYWDTGFNSIYSDSSLDVPWVSIMGNHDYGGEGCFADIKAQFDRTAFDLLGNGRWKMPSPYYSHKVEYDGFSLELFMIETNQHEANYGARHSICGQTLCGGRTANGDECIRWFNDLEHSQRQWLPRALSASTADWKIIVGHHKPDGGYANFLRPLLAQHNVQMVVGSHTHEMAFYGHYNNIGKPLMVVGAGGGAQVAPGCNGATMCSGAYGFGEVSLSAHQMEIKMHDVRGQTGGSTRLTTYICSNGRHQSSPCSR